MPKQDFDKVVSYAKGQIFIEDVGDISKRKLKIHPHKRDALLTSMSIPDSLPSRFVSTIAEAEPLTSLFFLQCIEEKSIDEDYPLSHTIPFIPNPSDNFKEKYADRLKTVKDNANEEIDSNNNLMKETFEEMLDKILNQISEGGLRLGKPVHDKKLVQEKIRKSLDKFIDINKGEFEKEFVDLMKPIMSPIPGILEQRKLLTEIDLYDKAKENSLLLLSARDTNFIDTLSHSLNLLISIQEINIGYESYCLECKVSRGNSPFQSSISRTGNVTFDKTCPTCGGNGIVHRVKISYPKAISTFAMGDTKLLQELIIAYVLSKFDWVRKIYVHKMIHAVPGPNSSEGPGVESDLVVVTTNNRLILVEVSTRRDIDNVTKSIETKISNLKNAGISYDAIFYITAGDQQFSFPYGEATVFSFRHISSIKQHIKETLTKKGIIENER